MPLLLGMALGGGFLLLAAGLGTRLLRWFGVMHKTETVLSLTQGVFAMGLGLLSLQGLPFLLLAFGAGQPLVFRAATALLALLLLPDMQVVFRSLRHRYLARNLSPASPSVPERIVLAIFVLLLPVVFLRALCPITDDDGLSYHLAASVRYLDAGQFFYLPTLTYTNLPVGVELLFTLLRGLHEDAPVGLVQFLFGMVIAALTYGFARRLGGRTAGLCAVVLLLVYRVFWEEMTIAHVDLGTSLGALLAAFALREWQVQKLLDEHLEASRWFAVSAFCSGLAATTKLLGVWVIAAFVVWLWRTQGGRVAVRYALIAACVVLPWLVRAAVLTSNPVYPMLYTLFGGREWTHEGWERVQHYFYLLTTLPGLPLTKPYLLLARAVVTGVALTIAVWVWRTTRTLANALPACAAAFFTVGVSASSGYNLRFLLAAFPCAAVAAGFALARRIAGWERRGLLFVSAAAVVLAFRIGGRGLEPNLPTAAKMAFGTETTDTYLRERLDDYPLVQWTNVHLPRSARLLIATWEERTAYYHPLALRANYWLQDSVHYENETRLIGDLRRLGVTHLVLKPMQRDWCVKSHVCRGRMETETARLTALAAQYGTPLHTENGITLYALALPERGGF